jgi:hypothetical protein
MSVFLLAQSGRALYSDENARDSQRLIGNCRRAHVVIASRGLGYHSE